MGLQKGKQGEHMLELECGGAGGSYGLALGRGRAVAGIQKKVYGGFSSGPLG